MPSARETLHFWVGYLGGNRQECAIALAPSLPCFSQTSETSNRQMQQTKEPNPCRPDAEHCPCWHRSETLDTKTQSVCRIKQKSHSCQQHWARMFASPLPLFLSRRLASREASQLKI